jgi:hypothetical protein
VIITPRAGRAMTLAERLAAFDPVRHGGEAMAAAPIGRERCRSPGRAIALGQAFACGQPAIQRRR